MDGMKEKVTRFFAKYYLYIVIVIICFYCLFILESLFVLLLSGLFSFISVLVAKLLKKVIAKKRNKVGQLFPTKNTYAFPSSHAAGLSSLLLSTYGDPVFIFIAISTAIILLARVRAKVHDYKDIIGGLLVGGTVTSLLFFGFVTVATL